MKIGIGISLAALLVSGVSVASTLFPSGNTGIMINPSQLDTLYQEVNGELDAVTADSDPVGVAMDVRLWGGLPFESVYNSQVERLNNGGFDDTSAWNFNSSWTVADGVASLTTVSGDISMTQPIGDIAEGKLYRVKFTVSARTTGDLFIRLGGTSNLAGSFTSNKEYDLLIQAEGVNSLLLFIPTAPFDGSIDNVSVKEIPGNHLTQPVSSNRPTYQTSGGLHWLQGNGTTQWMRSTFTLSQPWDRMSSIRQLTWGSDQVFGGVTANAGALYQGVSTPGLAIFDGSTLEGTGEVLNQDQSVFERHNNTASIIAVDDEADSSGTSGVAVPGGVTLFGDSTGGGFANARCYSMIMTDDIWDAAARLVAKDFTDTLAGI